MLLKTAISISYVIIIVIVGNLIFFFEIQKIWKEKDAIFLEKSKKKYEKNDIYDAQN